MDIKQLKGIVDSIRKQTPRGWILMSPNSIGEVLTTCAFAQSLIDKYGYPITLCVRPEHAPMVEALYPGRFTAIVPMNLELMRSFSSSGLIPPGYFDIDLPINLSPLQYGDGRLLDIHNLVYKRNGGSGLTHPDLWRYMLHLDWDAPMEKPCHDFFDKENTVFSSLGLDEGSFVLFQPGNNTNMPTPASFWSHLEGQFHQKNYSVLVNIKGSMLIDRSLRFSSAKQVDLGILDALYLVNKSYATIGGSTGLMLVNVFLDYPQEAQPLLHFITTDKYCEHYHLLNSDWNNAFVPFNSQLSLSVGAPEMISQSSKMSEWHIKSNLMDSDYQEVATAVFNNNLSSRFYVKPNDIYFKRDFPEPLKNKNNVHNA